MKVQISSGDLRHILQVFRQTGATDAIGGTIPGEPTLITTIRASIRPASAREITVASQRNLSISHVIALRYTADITPRDYLVFGSRTFSIVSMRNIEERGRRLELECVEQGPSGTVK